MKWLMRRRRDNITCEAANRHARRQTGDLEQSIILFLEIAPTSENREARARYYRDEAANKIWLNAVTAHLAASNIIRAGRAHYNAELRK